MRRRSASRAGERGFTLVEVLVSLAILSIVGTVLGVVFSIGMRTLLFPGASQDRLGAASYAIAIEQPLTEDVQRASCIQLPSDQDGGTCDAGTFQGLCSAGSLCIGWPDLVHPDQCDMALYAVSANPVYRQEWQGLDLNPTATTFPGVTVTNLNLSAAPPGLDVVITSVGPHPASAPASPLANPPTITLRLQVLANPWPTLPPSPFAGMSTSPC